MKKWITALTALLLLSCPMTAFAAESDINRVSGNQGIEVYGSCKSSKNYYEIVLGVAGIDTLDLPDGVTLSGKSNSAADNGLRVVIIPVTADEEAEAYAWMSNAATELGKEPVAYYLAFYRRNEPVQPEGKVAITMTLKDGYEKAKLFYMDGNARAKEVTYTTEQGNSSFGMEQTGYYLLVKTEDSRQPIDPGEPTNPGVPKTGDTTNIWLYLILMSASAVILFLPLIGGRRNESV